MKEELKLENVKKDMRKLIGAQVSNVSDWRLAFILPVTAIAIILGILLQKLWVGLLIFSVALYHIIRFAIEISQDIKAKRRLKSAIARGDFSVSVETLDHISTETVYEPHVSVNKINNTTKEAKFYYFSSGIRWREPDIFRHYEWSENYFLSSEGLDNTSVIGNEFYFITLQGEHDIAYIYNTKFFDFKEKNK